MLLCMALSSPHTSFATSSGTYILCCHVNGVLNRNTLLHILSKKKKTLYRCSHVARHLGRVVTTAFVFGPYVGQKQCSVTSLMLSQQQHSEDYECRGTLSPDSLIV